MANRFLTRDEVLLELGIPMFRLMLQAAAAKAAARDGDCEPVMVRNPIFRDCMPVAFDRRMLTPAAVQEVTATLDLMEATVRGRIKPG